LKKKALIHPLDSAIQVVMLTRMFRVIQMCVLASLILSLSSCGLPVAMGRSMGRALNGLQNLGQAVGGV
jgi:hypothetical protein